MYDSLYDKTAPWSSPGGRMQEARLVVRDELVGADRRVRSMPTIDSPATAQGTILGTLQYMAPEQLEGKEATARTDIFAFGAVLYEMVTGKKAFEGKSRASLIAAILEHDPPPPSTLQPTKSSGSSAAVAWERCTWRVTPSCTAMSPAKSSLTSLRAIPNVSPSSSVKRRPSHDLTIRTSPHLRPRRA
jgi:serine/threonine protein kinase